MVKLKGRMGALRSVLLSLFFAITVTACASKAPLPQAFPCEKPKLKGDTWADIAILSIEQAAAIDVCNIRNGVGTISPARNREISLDVPPPSTCALVGVDVAIGTRPTGSVNSIVFSNDVTPWCGPDTVGCTMPQGGRKYNIITTDTWWVVQHELCHAYYEEPEHTMDYLASRAK